MKIVTQISAFPEEKPDVHLIEKAKAKYVSLRREMQKDIKKLGAYAFCKKAQECLVKNDSYSQDEHALTSKEVYELADSVFEDYTNFTLNIKTFLKNVREMPNYEIRTIK